MEVEVYIAGGSVGVGKAVRRLMIRPLEGNETAREVDVLKPIGGHNAPRECECRAAINLAARVEGHIVDRVTHGHADSRRPRVLNRDVVSYDRADDHVSCHVGREPQREPNADPARRVGRRDEAYGTCSFIPRPCQRKVAAWGEPLPRPVISTRKA